MLMCFFLALGAGHANRVQNVPANASEQEGTAEPEKQTV
jgi:hypothetical protein